MYHLVNQNQFNDESDNLSLCNDNNKTMRNLTKRERMCFLFDTRNIVVISDHLPPTIMSKMNIDQHTNYQLLVLQYFDVLKQSVYILQTLLVDKNINVKRILEYVQNKFISTTDEQLIC